MRYEFEIEPFQSHAAIGEFELFDTELADEWVEEVSRSSPTYIRWVQSSLNQILGLRLAVDGDAGPQTRSAIRSFQQREKLPVTGVVGPDTQQALIAATRHNSDQANQSDEEVPWLSSIFPALAAAQIEDPSAFGLRPFTFAAEPFEIYPELDEFEALDPEFNDQGQREYSFPGIALEAEESFSFFGIPNSIFEALGKGLESVAVKLAVTFGYRDEVMLTNLVFFARHPERSGRKLTKEEPGFDSLSQEWLSIRNNLIRPALKAGKPTLKPPPPANGKTDYTRIEAQLPDSGKGYYSYPTKANGWKGKFGLPETIQALQAIGEAWQRADPPRPRIGIGDISLKGGGNIPGHVSHEGGVDIDIHPMRNDGKTGEVTWCAQGKCNIRIKAGKEGSCTVEPGYKYHPSYSQSLTQELVNLIRGNGVLKVKLILFNDPKVKGVQCYKGHNNHLHVRFYPPGTK